MPLTHFKCEVNGKAISFEKCLSCARQRTYQLHPDGSLRHCQYPYPYLAACVPNNEREGAGISATMLATTCPRKTMLELHCDYGVKPSSLQPSLKGTAQHAYLERFNEEGILAEVRLVKRMPSGRVISGKMDRYLPAFARLEDYKFKTEDHRPFTTAPLEYVAQLNIYRYMLVTGCTILETGENLDPQYVTQMILYPSNHKDWHEVEVPIWKTTTTEWLVENILDMYENVTEEHALAVPRGFQEPETDYFCQHFCPFVKTCSAAGGEYRDVLVEAASLHAERG